MKKFNIFLRASTMLAVAGFYSQSAQAQSAEGGGLEEIVVTAQKREQSLQDVPIAVTAVTQETLQANRIYTVNDLSAIAPGLTVKPSAGGVSVPAFTMRGQVSYGVVAGSDKQVSIYLDGVYIGSPRGSIFEMPDIQRLEVLRGPQGTLFGRNATAGAISVTTRDPSGEVHARLEGSYGNLDAYRIRATFETPQVGPFSAYFSYVRNSRRGDIENAAAGLLWDRSNAGVGFGATKSARWLGTVDSHSYFAAVKFEPSDSFRMVYKYDRNDDSGTPDGTAFLATNRTAPLTGALISALIDNQNVYADPSGKRPEIVSNGWVTARDQRVQGHSLTATWNATDSITVKNILAHRKARVFAPAAIDGLSSLTFTPQALVPYATLIAFSSIGRVPGIVDVPSAIAAIPSFAAAFAPNVGQRFLVIASQSSSVAKQWSDEVQVNYTSENLNATLGAMWFHSKDEVGGPVGQKNTFALGFVPNSGVIPLGDEGRYFNKATSLAAYAQLEYKVTPELELVAGARITRDKKDSQFRWDIRGAAQPLIVPPPYRKTKPNFQVGVNWKPDQDFLLYAKYSTSFVSGGSVAGIEYQPEVAKSLEAGLKADFLDNRLRTNLAVYHVTYDHFQSAGSTTAPNSVAAITPVLTQLYGAGTAASLISSLSTYVVDNGKLRVNGFEAEVTAAPTRGLIIGGSLAYTDAKFLFIQPGLLAANGGRYDIRDRPKWTASLYGSYETEPLFGDTTLQVRLDGQFKSRTRYTNNALLEVYPDGSNAAVASVAGYWLVNGRLALRHLDIGPADAELALWGKNIGNRKDAMFPLFTPLATSANFVQARTYGLELSVDF